MVQIELYKIFKKWRSYIGFIAIAVLVTVIQVAISFEGSRTLNFATRNLQQQFVFVGNFLNGYLVSQIILNAIFLAYSVPGYPCCGRSFCRRSNFGTYRMLITRPVSRFNLVTAKFFAGIIYTALLVFWLGVMSLGLGTVLFGTGELMSHCKAMRWLFLQETIFSGDFYCLWICNCAMSVVASLASLLSSLVENSIGPIITTMAIIIAFFIISALDVSVFQTIRPAIRNVEVHDNKKPYR